MTAEKNKTTRKLKKAVLQQSMMDISALKDSTDFLNMVLDHIDTAVFIADDDFRIQQFNASFAALFSDIDPDSEAMAFGDLAGCINAVKELKACGETRMCKNCQLRNALAATLDRPGETVRHHLERTFHINGKPIKKHLEYTTRPIVFRGREMTLFFVHDITDITLSRLELEEKQRQMEIDLAKAGEIQKALMLNQTPEIPAIRTGWYFSPSFKIGGDMFHIFEPAPGLVSAYMLDACGHGVSAALIAVTVKHFIDHLVAQDLTTGQTRTPGEVLRDLEKEFPFERFESHFTIIYLSLDCQSGELVYASAGHVPPVVTGPHERFDVLNEHGTIIGLGRNASQSGSRTKLTPGDKVLLYTDGLLDCFGPKGGIENAQRFYSAVKENSILPADQLTAAVIDQQQAMGQTAMADDDISLLAIEYLGLPG